MHRLSRLVTPLLVVVLCALVAWWVTRLVAGTPIAIPAAANNDAGGGASRVDAVVASARLFGSRKPGALSDNVRPLGVVADASGRGSVIVSVDGQAPKVYRVGDTLDGRLVTAIRPGEIELESGGARQVFRLPPPVASATGLTIIGSAVANTAAVGAPGGSATVPGVYVPESRYQAPPPPMQAPMRMSMPPPMPQQGLPQGTQAMPPGATPNQRLDRQGSPSGQPPALNQ